MYAGLIRKKQGMYNSYNSFPFLKAYLRESIKTQTGGINIIR